MIYDRTARLRAHLARLSRMGLRVAEDLHAQALAARDAKTTAELAKAFAQVSDEVCQTIALEAELAREARASGAAPRRRSLRATVEPDGPEPVKH
ncbi:hypothetical protein [Phenylobacterium sp.]|uniref:hypothetical protein n=1 Tax=Phenylobacterium sp. TaxID=1871053 RepID=UPI002DE60D18|nr:hypothetical protein [Phenylobacterium sp.]